MDYVFDTSAVIVLLEICGLGKQLEAFSRKNAISIPNKVKEEFLDGCKIDKDSLNVFSVVNPTPSKQLLSYFVQHSNSGEFWTISYSCSNGDCVCVIDDGFGRDLCKFLGMKFTGSIGIINEMKKQGYLSREDLLEIREKVGRSNFYLSKELLVKLDEICFS
jgi:predicted nucleic acid-binding protein